MKYLMRIIYYSHSIIEMLFGFKKFGKIIRIFLGNQKKEVQDIQLKNYPIRFLLRGKMDIWALKETWLDKFYERHGIAIENGWQVIDIGAGFGDFSVLAAFDKPESKIFAIEPFDESFNLLRKNIEINKIDNIFTFPLAIWSKTAEITLDLSKGEPLQAPTSDVLDNSFYDEQVKIVQALSLEDFINKNGIDKIDLMKIDCEGAEYEILCGCGSKTLSKIERITMEYHDGFKGRSHQELVDLLTANDFKVFCDSNIVHDDIGYLYAKKASKY